MLFTVSDKITLLAKSDISEVGNTENRTRKILKGADNYLHHNSKM